LSNLLCINAKKISRSSFLNYARYHLVMIARVRTKNQTWMPMYQSFMKRNLVEYRWRYQYLVVVVLPDPFQGMGAWRNSTETQQSGHSPRSGPEVKNGRSLIASTWWCGPRPLYPRGGPKCRDNDPEGPDHLVAPNRLVPVPRPPKKLDTVSHTKVYNKRHKMLC